MNVDKLVELGLSKSEATLYLALLKLGSADVKTLVYETGFFKANTYDSMEKLCEKGIVSKVVQNGVRTYNLEKPDSLIEFIQKKKSELEAKEELAKELAKEAQKSKENTHSSETAVVLRGVSGVKQIYSEIIEKKLDSLIFGSPIESETLIGNHYWKNFHLKLNERNIQTKMIFHKSLRHWKNVNDPKKHQLRFHDAEFESLTETTIYGDKVAFTVWTQKPVVTIIKNKHVADSYRQIFNILWKQSKE